MVEAMIQTKQEREIGSMRSGTEEISFLSRVVEKTLAKKLMFKWRFEGGGRASPREVERPKGGCLPGVFKA